jgi:hypothetical protein
MSDEHLLLQGLQDFEEEKTSCFSFLFIYSLLSQKIEKHCTRKTKMMWTEMVVVYAGAAILLLAHLIV